MIAQVYYHKTLDFGGKRLPTTLKPEDYKHLTQLDVASEEGAFILLNAIGPTSSHLTALLGCRSMSVGDVVEMNGRVMLCDMAGWKQVNWETHS